ncbi:MAG: DUF481 domain-containing protein [Bacteroidota bacterium]|nr:DUF481 domain-containing protein [Bacteroidota bacterium]
MEAMKGALRRNRMTKKALKTALLVILIISSFGCKAQFNDSIFHYISYAATGIINKTNNNSSFVLSNMFRYGLHKKNIRLNSTNSWIYGTQRHGLTNNDFTSTLDFNLYKTIPHFYYWGLGNYEKSYSLKIIDRLQAGVGAAYNLVDTRNAAINISDGILYEASNLQINDTVTNAYQTFRNSLRFRYHFSCGDLIVFDGLHFYQNSLSDGSDYIIKSINNLTFKIRKWLGFTTSATYNRNQRTNRENLLITFGLTAEKYF